MSGKLQDRRLRRDGCSSGRFCEWCRADQEYLLSGVRPVEPSTGRPVRVVDLFSGCGGMTLGLLEAAREVGRRIEVRLAADYDPEVLAIYRQNFPTARTT